jgi:hypothetical protein
MNMKHRTNSTSNTLYAYYWWLSEEGEAGEAVPLGRLEMI